MEDKIKDNTEKTNAKEIVFATQDFFNQAYINDLTKLIKTNTSVPTHTPRKFVDCFYLYFDGTSTYELYVYIQTSWKKITLS